MIKAKMTTADGKTLIVLGLSFGNLDKFRSEPGDTFIHINGDEMGIPVNILIFSGETEAHCTEMLAGGITPETVIHIGKKVKN